VARFCLGRSGPAPRREGRPARDLRHSSEGHGGKEHRGPGPGMGGGK